MMFKADIDKLKGCLALRGMSRRQLAHYAGVSPSTIDRILGGEATSSYTARKISTVFLKRRESLFHEAGKGGDGNAGGKRN